MKYISILFLFLCISTSTFSQNNYFRFNGKADVLLKCADRDPGNSQGRALVHDTNNSLTINYNNDFSGGLRVMSDVNIFQNLFVGKNVGIGTQNPTRRLDVNGDIKSNNIYVNGVVHANEVKIEVTKWADFVFDKDYKLHTLQEVETHINEHKRLPDIPSEVQVKEEGINVGEMQSILLQKIEELTLYMIDLKKENQEQNKEIQELKSMIKK